MTYVKPEVVASDAVRSIQSSTCKIDQRVLDSKPQLSTTSAYEADE